MGEISVQKTPLEGVILIKPQYFKDPRGFFVESYNKKDYYDAGITVEFVQDNHSKSQKGVLRGLHYQHPHAQGKLIRVLKGKIFDVVVDIRVGSPTYGEQFTVILSEEAATLLYVPVGFAHGFLVMEDNTEVMYKVTDLYHPEGDAGILWSDTGLAIPWPLCDIGLEKPLLSEKDTGLPTLSDIQSPFTC